MYINCHQDIIFNDVHDGVGDIMTSLVRVRVNREPVKRRSKENIVEMMNIIKMKDEFIGKQEDLIRILLNMVDSNPPSTISADR